MVLLASHFPAHADTNFSDFEKTSSAYELLFAADNSATGIDTSRVYDWSYSSSLLLAAGGAAAQSGNSGSGNSSDDSGPPDSHSFATLGDREPGEHVEDEAGNDKIWPHRLPFLGQKVISLGYDLPDPYGFAIIGSYVEQSLQISNLRVSTSGTAAGPYVSVNDFVTFGQSAAEALDFEAKFDFWLFPFMNVFFVAGAMDGEANVPLTVGVEGALDFLGLGGVCPDNPPIPSLRPDFCDENVAITAQPKYDGTNWGVGTVLAGGWRHYFVAIPITYVYSDLSNLKDNISTLNVEVLIGRTFDSKHPKRQMELFIGGDYLDVEQEISNSIVLPLSEVDPSLPDPEIFYQIHEVNTDKWNYIVGGNFQMNEHWSIQAQIGFGGSRDQYTLGGTLRW
jgi:hypothetical protein